MDGNKIELPLNTFNCLQITAHSDPPNRVYIRIEDIYRGGQSPINFTLDLNYPPSEMILEAIMKSIAHNIFEELKSKYNRVKGG